MVTRFRGTVFGRTPIRVAHLGVAYRAVVETRCDARARFQPYAARTEQFQGRIIDVLFAECPTTRKAAAFLFDSSAVTYPKCASCRGRLGLLARPAGGAAPRTPVQESLLRQLYSRLERAGVLPFILAGYLLKPVTFQQFVEVMSTINKYWALMEMP